MTNKLGSLETSSKQLHMKMDLLMREIGSNGAQQLILLPIIEIYRFQEQGEIHLLKLTQWWMNGENRGKVISIDIAFYAWTEQI